MLEIHDQIKMLTRIGVALSSEHDLNKLLDMIVREARALTNADAGSIYIKEGAQLQFLVSQNDSLARRFANRGMVMESFKPFPLEISNKSIAGYVAKNAVTLNIPDVYKIPADRPFKHNPSFDEKNDYLTRSMLVVPMLDPEDRVIGVLQLINALKWEHKPEAGPEDIVPFDDLQQELVTSLASQAAVAVTNARLTSELKSAHLDTIYRLSVAAEYKDQDTASHIKRMSLYSKIVAANLGLDDHDVELMLYASPMHDVGKLGVPDAILLKPGPLDAEEWKVMQNHTIYGAKILEGSDSEIVERSRVIALTHHEKWNGKGYPQQLKGEDIPLFGRIVALADVFDALTSKRPYKKAWPLEQARDEIQKDAGTHFDPKLAEVFAGCFDQITEVYEKNQD